MRDTKNFTIGFLSAVCLFLFYGYTDNKNVEFDQIKVKRIIVEENMVSNGINLFGNIDVNGSISVHSGIDRENRKKNSHITELTSSGLEIFKLANDNELWYRQDPQYWTQKIFIGISDNNHGMINLYDKYGDPGHQRLGTGKFWNVLNKN